MASSEHQLPTVPRRRPDDGAFRVRSAQSYASGQWASAGSACLNSTTGESNCGRASKQMPSLCDLDPLGGQPPLSPALWTASTSSRLILPRIRCRGSSRPLRRPLAAPAVYDRPFDVAFAVLFLAWQTIKRSRRHTLTPSDQMLARGGRKKFPLLFLRAVERIGRPHADCRRRPPRRRSDTNARKRWGCE